MPILEAGRTYSRLFRATVLAGLFLLLAPAPASAQGDYQFDFIAAEPTTYDHATGEGGEYDGRAVGTTVVEQLQGGDFTCGDLVVFFVEVTAPSGLAAPETIQIDFEWDADSTGQPGAGYTDLVEAEPNTGDTGMSTDGDETVAIVSETVDGTLDATVAITGLESDEMFILRLEVRLTCIPNSNPTGNLGARLAGARVTLPVPRALSVGAQNVPMIGVPTPASAPPAPPPSGGVETGLGGTAGGWPVGVFRSAVHAMLASRSPAAEQSSTEFGRPVRVVIPAIGVSAGVGRLGLNPDGTLAVPTDFDKTGWWSKGTVPGERGPAVIVGHVDSKAGPAVFYRLGALRRGDVVRVRGAGGTLARFVVQRLERVPKSAFPTERVYGAVRYAALRLITCGGAFDASAGHYTDNLVVYARLATGSSRAALSSPMRPLDELASLRG